MTCPNPPDLWWPSLMTTIGRLESLADLLEAAGYDVRLYSSATMLCERGGLVRDRLFDLRHRHARYGWI